MRVVGVATTCAYPVAWSRAAAVVCLPLASFSFKMSRRLTLGRPALVALGLASIVVIGALTANPVPFSQASVRDSCLFGHSALVAVQLAGIVVIAACRAHPVPLSELRPRLQAHWRRWRLALHDRRRCHPIAHAHAIAHAAHAHHTHAASLHLGRPAAVANRAAWIIDVATRRACPVSPLSSSTTSMRRYWRRSIDIRVVPRLGSVHSRHASIAAGLWPPAPIA